MLRDRHGNAGNINFLEGVLADERYADVAGDRDHGHRIHVSSCNAGDQIGCARARSCQDDTGLARCAGISIGRMRRALFVRGQHMANAVTILVERVVNIQDSASRIAENRVNTLFDQGLAQNL